MALKNPKSKGNTFERKVANMLTEWSGVKFMRTPASGAIHNFQDKRVVSDIVPPLSIGKFPFSIECKNVNCSWELSNLLEGTSETLNAHWTQCVTDAEREGLLPMLVFTKNFRKVYTVLRYVDFKRLNIALDKLLRVTTVQVDVVIFDFQEFLSAVSCDQLTKIEIKTIP